MTSIRFFLLACAAVGAVLFPWAGAPECGAFSAGNHTDITRDVLEDARLKRTIGGKELTFSELAILQIQEANVSEDAGPSALKASHHFDDERIADASARLVRIREDIVDDLSGSFFGAFIVRQRLGAALHAIQDFYSHTNWVEMGSSKINRALGRRTLASPPRSLVVCGPDEATLRTGLTRITSGYFDLTDPCDAAPAGKCLHGALDCEGINKDTSGRPGFDAARALAVAASIDFVEQILDAEGVAGNARAIRVLMGRSSPFAFALDISDSMEEEIDSVRTALRDAFDSVQDADFSLDLFGPTVDPVRRTADRVEFISWVDALATEGPPGDGAEPSMTALFRTVAQADPGTTLFLVTDAACADADLAPAVGAVARSRGVTIFAVLTGPDAQSDPCFGELTESTGGSVLAVAAADAGGALASLRARAAARLDTIFAADGTLAGERTFTFPVDCGVTRLVVTAFAAGGATAEVKRPNAAVVVDADADATVKTFTNGTIADVTAPADGTWTVRIDGTGRYSVRVEADGAVTLRNVRFAVRTPSAEHARLAPVAGMPAAGTPSTLSAVVGAGATDVKFLLVDEEGTTLATPALAQQDPDAGADRFVGTFTPPSEPFRVAITAKDATGCALRRTWPALFVPSTLRVHVDPASVSAGLTAGTMTTIGVTVFNDGPAGTFDVVATDDDGRITRVAPASVALATGAHADVQIDLPVSADERLGASVGLAIAAVEDGGTRANTTTASIPVTTGTLALGLRQRLLRDRPTAGGDTVNVSGRLVFDTESRDAQIDPATDRLHVEVGDPSNPFVLNVPAGDPAWRTTSKGLVTWKAAAGATPQGSVVIDPRRRSFTLKLSKFDFPAPPGPAARVTLRAGDDVGTAAIARRR